MAAVIAFISQKGGVGKSTLARALAREAAVSGLKVKIAGILIPTRRPLSTGIKSELKGP